MGVLGRPRWEPRGCLDLGSNKTLRHENESRTKNPRNPKMSYYRYITGVYKSYWPELNRTLRSSSVPRTVPDLDSSRYVRGTSMPPNAYYSDSHYNISAETLNARNTRARSPLQSRELDRYFETRKRVNYIGDCSAGGTSDFRYYNYRRVPYFGGSDNYQYMKQKPTGWGGRRL